jgi:hypothetical protein
MNYNQKIIRDSLNDIKSIERKLKNALKKSKSVPFSEDIEVGMNFKQISMILGLCGLMKMLGGKK